MRENRGNLLFILTLLVVVSACGWRSGEYKGTSKITKVDSGGYKEIIPQEKSGSVTFNSETGLKISGTQIPNCTVLFRGGDTDSNQISGFDRSFAGDMNSGKGCSFYLSETVAVEIEITQGSVKHEENGEITLKLFFFPKNSTNSLPSEYEFRGKKGWF